MSRLTVRARVTLAAAGVLALGLIVVSAGVNLLLDQRLDADASSALRDRVAAQLATLEVTSAGIKIEEHRNQGALDQHSWIYAADGVPIDRAPAGADVLRAVASLSKVSAPVERKVGGDVQLRAVPVFGPGHRRAGTVVVGVSLLPYHHSQDIALIGTVVLSLLFLALAAFAVHRAVGAALEPVEEMTRRAADWGAQDLHRRFALGPARDELFTLADTFNGLLGRIEGVLRHEQRFSAEMAHELRTPLTGLRAEAELALASTQNEPQLREALERIVEGTERMTSVIETLLSSARALGSSPPGSCDVAAPMAAATERVRTAAAEQGVDVVLRLPSGEGSVQAPADIVSHALGPLLENAVRHARARIEVSSDRRPGAVVVVVSDDGAGIGDVDPEELFSPGVSTTDGAGLGLSLARRLARSSGGDVIAVPDASGGRFELTLPSVGAPRS